MTRVLFFYLNDAVRRWEQGISVHAIDGALRGFGWPMGPLRLIDEVGVDVSEFIFGEMKHYFPERFVRSTACARMLAAGMRGRKNGASRGFYRYENRAESSNEGELLTLFPDRAVLQEASRRHVPTPDAIVSDLMNVMSDEAERCLAEGIVKSPDDVDFAFVSGAGFPPFRGGLLHWARAERRAKEGTPKL
jgi:3-hydroxyacyl-CoA dehydrogenase/enoyl-CoA hydratase/3-hydroxybutyryl-CoA epimerase